MRSAKTAICSSPGLNCPHLECNHGVGGVALCGEEQGKGLLWGLRDVPRHHATLVSCHHNLRCVDGGHEVDECCHWGDHLRGGKRGRGE